MTETLDPAFSSVAAYVKGMNRFQIQAVRARRAADAVDLDKQADAVVSNAGTSGDPFLVKRLRSQAALCRREVDYLNELLSAPR
jgi:hypothetical protein